MEFNVKQYIATGILEDYVLGVLSEKEKEEVELYAQQYQAIKTELDNIEIALMHYITAHSVKAPVGLADKVIAQLDSPSDTPTSSNSSNSSGKTVTKNNPSSNGPNIGGILGGLLALLALGASFWLYQQNKSKDETIQALQTQMTTIQSDCEVTKKDNESLIRNLEVLYSSDNTPIVLKGTDNTPNAVATIYYNKADKKCYLNANNLPQAPTGKQYQLWAIVNGQPVDMGVFEQPIAINESLQDVPFIDAPQAFAVTLEPEGGSVNPTLEEMVVIGEVSI